MYADTSHRKTYTRYTLRDSFRKGGKVKHRTVASLSSCSQEEIAAIKLALKHRVGLAHLMNLKQIKTREGIRLKLIQRQGAGGIIASPLADSLCCWHPGQFKLGLPHFFFRIFVILELPRQVFFIGSQVKVSVSTMGYQDGL